MSSQFFHIFHGQDIGPCGGQRDISRSLRFVAQAPELIFLCWSRGAVSIGPALVFDLFVLITNVQGRFPIGRWSIIHCLPSHYVESPALLPEIIVIENRINTSAAVFIDFLEIVIPDEWGSGVIHADSVTVASWGNEALMIYMLKKRTPSCCLFFPHQPIGVRVLFSLFAATTVVVL